MQESCYRMIAQCEAGAVRKFLAAVLALATLPAPCVSAAENPGKAVARLFDGGVVDGARHAGLEIILPGAAITYWRDPGEAGVPPAFDFAGSDNVAGAEALFPQPERIDEAGAQAFGYRREVVFPIHVTPRDASRTAVLALRLDFAVCDRLCLPIHAEMSLTLPPQAPPGDARLAAALRTVPRRLDLAQTAAFARISAHGPSQWLLRLHKDAARDVFVEAPAGFVVEAAPAGEPDTFMLTLIEHPPEKPRLDAPVRVTVAGASPVEFELMLPN